jgi:hypothetical protein
MPVANVRQLTDIQLQFERINDMLLCQVTCACQRLTRNCEVDKLATKEMLEESIKINSANTSLINKGTGV